MSLYADVYRSLHIDECKDGCLAMEMYLPIYTHIDGLPPFHGEIVFFSPVLNEIGEETGALTRLISSRTRPVS